MPYKVAKIAVSGATYWIDRPYDYLIPDCLAGEISAGVRVFVPFSRSNRRCEGIVLSVAENQSCEGLKSVESVLDKEPVLTREQINLALFMHERFFCTVYEAFKAILPAGLWFDSHGKRRVKDKTCEKVRLSVSCEEASGLAQSKRKKSPQQANLLTELSSFGELPVNELLSFTGARKQSLKSLAQDGYVEFFSEEVFRRPADFSGELSPLPVLSEEQNSVYCELRESVSRYSASVSLLQGVTGSGKTSVYVKLIDSVLKDERTVILLVPEISLTPQMINTFSWYFGNDIAVLHSSLSLSERYDEWKRVKTGQAHLVIGTRSAVFAPCENLGLIIIDEQQEETYKSENNPRYNAEDVAKYLCFKSGCMLLLGSATPDIRSRYQAQIGKYAYYRLDKRYNQHSLPSVKIVDMKAELLSGNNGCISNYLKEELKTNIENGEQSILFLNRRGAHKLITCSECGHVYKCPNCSVSLTYHSKGNKLMCHYCGYTKRVDARCPECGGSLTYFGAGTQLVEEELNKLFPETDIIRIDADVLNASVTHKTIFERFSKEKIPIMIGTQMVTKGLNFENVTLVGVINADQGLYTGDFRAGERTFSLITQVIGRSGRGEKHGRAVIQTFTPENEIILRAAQQNYDAFYESEIVVRKIQNSPPFCDYLCITVTGNNETNVVNAAECVKKMIRFSTKNMEDVEILGPVPLNVVKVNNIFRYRVNIKCPSAKMVRPIISNVVVACNNEKKFKGLSFYADNDPND